MAATFEDLIQEVLLNLEGFTGDQDLYGLLQVPEDAADISATATSFVVNGSGGDSAFTAGVIEVGDELMYARAYNPTTRTFSGLIRGWRGTTASTHPYQTLVRNNPKIPRHAVKRAINDTITSLYPRVYGINSELRAYQASKTTYDLPPNAKQVLRVAFQSPTDDNDWIPCKRWKLNPFSGGNSIDIWDGFPGRQVRIDCAIEAFPMEYNTDYFSSATTLPEWTRDLVVMGACYRLSSYIDAARLGATSAAQVLQNQQNPPGAAINVSKYFLGLYQQRLTEAEERLQDLYPPQRHYIQ